MAYLENELLPLPDGYTPVHLETERLTLDSIQESDAEEIFPVTFGDPEVLRYIPADVSPDVDHVRSRLRSMMNVERRFGYSFLMVRLKETREVVGICGLIPVQRKGPEVEIGYHTGQKFWRKGYTSEAAAACLRWGFEEVGLDKIIAVCDEPNTGSWKVMEKIGMHRVGLTDKYYDMELLLYDLTAEQHKRLANP